MDYPTADYYTILAGEIWGPVRCESLDGSEMYLPEVSGSTRFLNFKPFEQDGKMWGVSNIQKKSKKGWIKTDPDCYHRWYWFRQQKQDDQGNWIPGTELGFYFRKPFSWRWDVAGTVIDEILRHWIWTKGYLGGHWD